MYSIKLQLWLQDPRYSSTVFIVCNRQRKSLLRFYQELISERVSCHSFQGPVIRVNISMLFSIIARDMCLSLQWIEEAFYISCFSLVYIQC